MYTTLLKYNILYILIIYIILQWNRYTCTIISRIYLYIDRVLEIIMGLKHNYVQIINKYPSIKFIKIGPN